MEFSEKVFVLQVGKFRETDLWVRLLSPTRGLLSAFAFGGSRSRRRFMGCLDVCNQVLFRIQPAKRGAYLALQEGVLINGPRRLRTDWARYGMANNCIKYVQAFDVGSEGAGKVYQLLEQILQLLEEADTLPVLLPIFFRARLAFDQGYPFDTQQCSLCSAVFTNGGNFAVREGIMLCHDCADMKQRELLHLEQRTLAVLQVITQDPPKAWASLEFDGNIRNECARTLDSFLEYHVGLVWENGRFVRV